MSKRRREKQKQGASCVNHPSRYETMECERCHQNFCSECVVEDWHETFFQQFIGEKRKMVKQVYCIPCRQRILRIRVIASIGLLTILLLPLVLWFIAAVL
ncbi:MAG: hypothetical protein ACFFFG_17540 [Candidatus Thorarchaeota archaeon]